MGKYAGELRLKKIRGGIELYKYIAEGSGSWSYFSIKEDRWKFVNTSGWRKLEAAETLWAGTGFMEMLDMADEYYEQIAREAMERVRDLPDGPPKEVLFEHTVNMTEKIKNITYRKVRSKVLDIINIQNALDKIDAAYELINNYDMDNVL